jgi:TPR repeat protein
MNKGAAAVLVNKAEEIKWWNALAVLLFEGFCDMERGLELARHSLHPDAQWLAALFPAGVAVSRDSMCQVMVRQGDDPRALLFASRFGSPPSKEWLLRAAEMGYAPAQMFAALLSVGDFDARFQWAAKSSAQGYREAVGLLGCYLVAGWGFERDEKRGIESGTSHMVSRPSEDSSGSATSGADARQRWQTTAKSSSAKLR